MRGSRNFFQGGGGVQARRSENSLDNVFVLLFYFLFLYSPQLILQLTEGAQWFYYRENYTFQRIQRGPTFSRGGSNFFSRGGGGGPNANFYRNPYFCDFLGGWVRTPIPLWIRTWTGDQRDASSRPTAVQSLLCPSARHVIHCLLLVQHTKTGNRPDITEDLLTWT